LTDDDDLSADGLGLTHDHLRGLHADVDAGLHLHRAADLSGGRGGSEESVATRARAIKRE
jgi:hypothetical protein